MVNYAIEIAKKDMDEQKKFSLKKILSEIEGLEDIENG